MRHVRCISPEEAAIEPNCSEKYRQPSLEGEKQSPTTSNSSN